MKTLLVGGGGLRGALERPLWGYLQMVVALVVVVSGRFGGRPKNAYY